MKSHAIILSLVRFTTEWTVFPFGGARNAVFTGISRTSLPSIRNELSGASLVQISSHWGMCACGSPIDIGAT